MTHYLFPETGCIPGVPGTFAGCRVDIADDGTVTTQPLARHPAPEEASADAPTADIPAPAPEEPIAKAVPLPEQVAEPETL